MKVAAVMSDLLLFSRIESAAAAADIVLVRVESPADVPNDVDLVLVDWSARRPDWAHPPAAAPRRVVLFGPHTDLEAHAAARAAGIGPMWARSKLLAELPRLLVPEPGRRAEGD
jgi:hypothetical protein